MDIEGHTLIRLDPMTGKERLGMWANELELLFPGRGRFLCAGDSGIYFLDPDSGKLTVLADPEADKRLRIDLMMENVTLQDAWAGTISTVKNGMPTSTCSIWRETWPEST